MGKQEILEVDLNKVSNYLVIETYHERYYFSTVTEFIFEHSLRDVIESTGYGGNSSWEAKGDGKYQLDITHRRTLDETEERVFKIKGVQQVMPESVIIIDLALVNKDNCFEEFIWGHTENKYGMFDIIKEDK